MTALIGIIDQPTVEVYESTADLDADAFEARRRTVEEKQNRAVSGIVRDGRDRLLLARYEGEGRWGSWRLPGSKVGNVTDFESRLREHLTGFLGNCVAGIEPTQVQKHTARRVDDSEDDGKETTEEPSLFYVLCDVELDGSPTEIVEGARTDESVERAQTDESVELGWFAEKPDDVINEGVLSRLFDEE